jgi:hypothetical protein
MVEDIENYMMDRFETQYKYYSQTAKRGKYKYFIFQIIIIVVSAIIPIVNVTGIGSNEQIRIVSSMLGGSVVISTSILQLLKSHETWLIYRGTANALLAEKYMFTQGAGIYSQLSSDQRMIKFVERVEVIIAEEGTKYFSVQSQKFEFRSEPSKNTHDI